MYELRTWILPSLQGKDLLVQSDVELALNSYQCDRQERVWDLLEQTDPKILLSTHLPLLP
jgi:hypothetical protein